VLLGAGVATSTAAAVGANLPAEGKLASAAFVLSRPTDAAVWVGAGVAVTVAAPVVAQPTAKAQVLATTKGEAANCNQACTTTPADVAPGDTLAVVELDVAPTAAAAIGDQAVGHDMLVACNMVEVADGTLLMVPTAPANAPARRAARTLLRFLRWPTNVGALPPQSLGPTTSQDDRVRQGDGRLDGGGGRWQCACRDCRALRRAAGGRAPTGGCCGGGYGCDRRCGLS